MSQRGEGEHAATRAEGGPAGDHDMGLEPHTTIQPDAGADHAIGTDRYVIGQLGPGVDDGARMNLRHRRQASMILADIVASATIVLSTVASPENFQMLSFLCSLVTLTCS